MHMLKRSLYLAMIALLAVESGARADEAVKKDVPYVPTPEPVVEQMLKMVDVKDSDVVYDLGCGDGRIVVTAVKKGAKRGVGVDIDPQRIKESNERAQKEGVTDKVEFVNKNLFEMDFKEASVLTLYLLPEVNLRLRPKILDELKPGSRVVSHAFDMDDWQADEEATVDPGGESVYFWIVPAKVDGTWKASLKSPSGQTEATLNLKQQFQNVSGTATVDGKEQEIKDGKLKGDQLSFSLANEPDVKYTATVNEGKLEPTGEASVSGAKS